MQKEIFAALIFLFIASGITHAAQIPISFVSPPTPGNDTFESGIAQIEVWAGQNLSICKANMFSDVWGDGREGQVIISSQENIINRYASIAAQTPAGNRTIETNGLAGFGAGDEILIIQITNTSGGQL